MVTKSRKGLNITLARFTKILTRGRKVVIAQNLVCLNLLVTCYFSEFAPQYMTFFAKIA